tara:strand:- start:60 stop:1046 length:987 start_codon:yes stop_codon:yes gene_type:complete
MEEFHWEFHNGSFGKSIYVIAEFEGKIVGTNCVIPINIVDKNGNVFKTGKSEDTLVDPDFRGKKIFVNIYDYLIEVCREEGILVIWGFSSAIKAFKKIKFSIPFSGKKSLVVNNIPAAYNVLKGNKQLSFEDKVRTLGMCVLGYSKRMLKGKGEIGKEYKVITTPILDERIEKLIQRNLGTSNSQFAIQQDSTFQSWRIYDNPNYYKVHSYAIIDKNDNLLGYILLNSHKNKSAFICQATFDFTVLSDKQIIGFLKYIINDMFKQGVVLIRDFVFDTNDLNMRELKILDQVGFKHFKKGNGLVWREIGSFDFKPEDFYLSRIATQGVN